MRVVCVPVVHIPLATRHRMARRKWAHYYRDSDAKGWELSTVYRPVPIQFRVYTRRVLVCRERSTRNNTIFVQKREHFRRGGDENVIGAGTPSLLTSTSYQREDV
ncbi:hypothetical protein TNCV_2017901 [Trichonephila clavipes]|nr:hypothetical protein TNCV_2017901 [Trichonephila clavipes]